MRGFIGLLLSVLFLAGCAAAGNKYKTAEEVSKSLKTYNHILGKSTSTYPRECKHVQPNKIYCRYQLQRVKDQSNGAISYWITFNSGHIDKVVSRSFGTLPTILNQNHPSRGYHSITVLVSPEQFKRMASGNGEEVTLYFKSGGQTAPHPVILESFYLKGLLIGAG